MSASNGIAGKAGRWSARHPWTAISLWIAFVAAAVLIGSAVGTKQLTESESASGESGVAARTLDRAGFGLQPGEQVIVQSKTLKATDPAFRAVVGDVISRLESTPNVVKLRSPYSQNTISKDGHSALVSFEIPGTFDTAGGKVEPIQAATAAAQSAHPGFRIAEAGDGSFSKAYDDTQGKDFQKAEQLSLPITLLILVVAFGGLLIAGIPVALAMSAVMAALGLTAVASQLLPVTDVTQSVILLIGLAVGVDYSIFYIARQRQERARGEGPIDAIEIAAATSGRAVLVSGLTVMAAMSGMFLAGNGVFSGIALATILVVATAIIGSLTVLPALLAPKSAGFLTRVPGHRAMGRGFRFAGRGIAAAWAFVTWPFRTVQSLLRRRRGERTIWNRILTPVLRHPVISVVASAAVLVALAIPAADLKLGLAPADYGMSKSLPVMQAKAAIDKAFPGSPSPAVVVIEAKDVTAPQVTQAIAGFEQEAISSGHAFRPFTLQVSQDHSVARLYVPIKGDGHNDEAVASMKALRTTVVPQTLNSGSGITQVSITGEAAGSEDFNQVMRDRAPIVIGFVLLLSFVLLLVTFRSLIVPIKAIVLNLLSVAAAYGILVAVFQHTWAQGLLGFKSDGAIEAWLPIFLFVVLFGLSMDYHVFILSRVRELWEKGVPSDQAVEQGITETAGVVTSAAIVMVAVFAIFASLSGLDMKQLGVGLATAILLDATLVRAVLLPATMKLLGDRNWYLPSKLNWLPRVSHGTPALGS
jgi:putative drug exporter of the RND superfamily